MKNMIIKHTAKHQRLAFISYPSSRHQGGGELVDAFGVVDKSIWPEISALSVEYGPFVMRQ